MTTLTVAAVQMAMADDVAINVATAERLVREAAAEGAQLVLIPELFEGPYFCKDMAPEHFDRARPVAGHPTVEHFRGDRGRVRRGPAAEHLRAGRTTPRYNSVVMVDADGSVLGTYRKSHIPDGPGYTEKYYFNPGDTGFRVWRTQHAAVGVGDLLGPVVPRVGPMHGADGRRGAVLPDRHRERATRPRRGIRAGTGNE